MTFMEEYRAGLINADAIHDRIEAWHNTPDDERSLARYLGMTDEEYFDWVRDPATLSALQAPAPPSQEDSYVSDVWGYGTPPTR